MRNNSKHILAKIIRGEHAASESYDQALAGIKSPSKKSELQKIKLAHQQSMRELTNTLKTQDRPEVYGSGGWGLITHSVVGASKLINEKTIISALETGEKLGLDLYKKALTAEIPEATRRVINEQCIPSQQRHIKMLHTIGHFA